MAEFDYDYIIVGSGFGGAVSAMRLAEKGYSVLVLEAGPRTTPKSLPKTNWQVQRFLFKPRLGLRGIMRMDYFRGLMVLSGAGVGGGSLVYANTLIEPSEKAFEEAAWPQQVGVENWHKELAPYYQEAKRMLGVTPSPTNFPADQAMKQAAEKLGYGDTFHPVNVGIFFGEPGKDQDDPYFGGQGPKRSGCTLCGGCMIGCKENAKNTLDKNYLFFAERFGAMIEANAQVEAVVPLPDAGYQVEVVTPGLFSKNKRSYRARNLVVAAGVLGTMKLLLKAKQELRTMPHISDTLGTEVRTNSESLIGVRSYRSDENYSKGIAIASGVNPDHETKIEAVRYPQGSDAMGLISNPLLYSQSIVGRILETLWQMVRHPINFVRGKFPVGFARQTIILLVMQSKDSKMKIGWKRALFGLLPRSLAADFSDGRPPVNIPEGNRLAESLAEVIDGQPGGSIPDMLNTSVTAHILGGCPMGTSSDNGVIDQNHEMFNYPGIYVAGGAAIPANLGVNPSLTITAMAERFVERIPAKVAVPEDQEKRA